MIPICVCKLDAHIIFKLKILCFCKDIYSFVSWALSTWKVTLLGSLELLLWNKIALQCCASVWCTVKSISYMYAYIPSPSWSSLLPPHPSHLGHQGTELSLLCCMASSHYLFFFLFLCFLCLFTFWAAIMQMLDFLYWSYNFHIVSLFFKLISFAPFYELFSKLFLSFYYIFHFFYCNFISLAHIYSFKLSFLFQGLSTFSLPEIDLLYS